MPSEQLRTPVALFVFNRPDLTEKTFAEIRRARPRPLMVVAAGPRPDVAGEAEHCAAARAVTQRIDWPCEVLTDFAEANLGCKRRVASGLDWVFRTVGEAIILEDDCLPHPTFFRFCEDLLDYYRNDERVMHIAGSNYQLGRQRTSDSYYFSRSVIVWGWATWRRAWRHFDLDLKLWPMARDQQLLRGVLPNARAVEFWSSRFEAVHTGRLDKIWALQWWFACWMQNGLAIHPRVNLISNIGFDSRATNTTISNPLAALPVEPMESPLRHPRIVIRNRLADDFIQRVGYASRRGTSLATGPRGSPASTRSPGVSAYRRATA